MSTENKPKIRGVSKIIQRDMDIKQSKEKKKPAANKTNPPKK